MRVAVSPAGSPQTALPVRRVPASPVVSASSMQGTLPRTNGALPAGARLVPPGQAHRVVQRQAAVPSTSSSPAAGWARVVEPTT
eukprot:2031880-Amphidinium_carterae.1